jgi:solute carrier family 25 (mitochondrial aspartate/glutamate transporter), member 12/13
MSAPATIKEAVKEGLLGSEDPVNLSAKSKATFLGLAEKDAETGEMFMTEEKFIDAVAPADEDYVCAHSRPLNHATLAD